VSVAVTAVEDVGEELPTMVLARELRRRQWRGTGEGEFFEVRRG
jgi:hypothetical protein